MSKPLFAMPVLLVFLMGGAALAQQQVAPWEPGVRHIELTGEQVSQVHKVGISPGLPTVIRIHGVTIERNGVRLEGHERMWMSVAEDAILLVPSEHVALGEPLRLTVSFKDGAHPANAIFKLVAHPAQAERLVEIHRMPRTAESLRAELKGKEAELQQHRVMLTRLQAELKQPAGLTGLLAKGQLGETGVAVRTLAASSSQRPEESLRVLFARSFRSTGRVAVDLWLESPRSTPWVVKGAVVRGKMGEELKGLTVWQEAPTPEKPQLRVVLEAEVTGDEAHGPFTVKLWEADGTRTITLGGVTFP